MPEQVHIFVYCNPTSGGNKARALLELPGGKSSFAFEEKELNLSLQVRVFDLKTTASREEGFKELKEFKTRGAKVKAVAAGGDGTVKWVIAELQKVDALDTAIGVIPFGTGNDMARILGWGSTAPNPLIGGEDMKALKSIIAALAAGEEIPLDVWEVTNKVDETEGRIELCQGKAVVEREDKAKSVTEYMINYCSFGQDARAVFGFEGNRRKTQLMNKVQFALEGAYLSIPGKGQRLTGVTMKVGKVSEDYHKPVEVHQGIIFQNIPSYAAGSDFWDAKAKWKPGDDHAPQLVGDGHLEIHGLHKLIDIGLHKASLGSRAATSKLKQTDRACLVFEGKTQERPVYCQIDGEPMRLVKPISCEISLGLQVRMIRRNDAALALMASCKEGDQVLKSGFMLKSRKGERNTWNSRFVAVVQRKGGKELNLEWYLGKQLRGVMHILKDGKMESHVRKLEHGGCRPNTAFAVEGRGKRYFATPSEDIRSEWLSILGFVEDTGIPQHRELRVMST